ncbi:hypothetical protein [Halorhabdus amylolytica]|uniref:hypothetical protein n=1 Tax=Halorhabdus amylolytica TaxID=2559573 RepID=UPI0010A9C9B4|nr:hypothetical protein [Halorhabdus amylolytica]
MHLRDAVEADAEHMASLTESPPDVMRNLVHDRTVRVAVEVIEADDAVESQRDEQIIGVVSFDAREQTVHVTQIAGSERVCRRLLEEPIRFARTERMAVELLVPEDEQAVRTAAEAKGFMETGNGPRFSGQPTTRFRLAPNDGGQERS